MDRVRSYDAEFTAAASLHCRSPSLQTDSIRWQRPPDGFYKLNVDGAVNVKEG